MAPEQFNRAHATLPDAMPTTATPIEAPVRTTVRGSISLVIVNYHQWDETRKLVDQVLLDPTTPSDGLELVVIDNHSPRHRCIRQLRRRARVTLRRWGKNRGFARAVNEGCWLAQGEWLLLLNPDVSVPVGFCSRLSHLLAELETTIPNLGILGLGLRNADGSTQGSAGPFPTLLRTLSGLLLPRAKRKYHLQQAAERTCVPWVTGCCLLVRRECLQELGGFDDDYFLYYEDVDLCRRAQARGWSVWLEPSLHVVHHAPLHARRVSPLLRVLTRHALLTYASKHWPRWQRTVLSQIIRLEAIVRSRLARWKNRARASEIFAQLGQIARLQGAGLRKRARRKLERLVRKEEIRRDHRTSR